MSMTISQALRRIKKLKGLLAELQGRAERSVGWERTAPPAFDFRAAIEEANTVRTEMIKLETWLAVTNATTKFKHEGADFTLAAATRVLQELKGQIAWYKALPVRAQTEQSVRDREYDGEKYLYVDKTWMCALPEKERDAKVRELQDKFDALNDAVEATNHKTSLVEV